MHCQSLIMSVRHSKLILCVVATAGAALRIVALGPQAGDPTPDGATHVPPVNMIGTHSWGDQAILLRRYLQDGDEASCGWPISSGFSSTRACIRPDSRLGCRAADRHRAGR